MNTKRIFTWGGFIIIVVLIIWGLIAASNKAKQEELAVGPVDQVSETDWVSSTSTVPVTLIEYSDFECPACGAYFPLVERLLRENPTQVRLVYRHFPLTMHPNAVPAATAAEAAGRQGKFWEMYRMLFMNQESWMGTTNAKTAFAEYARQIGLDMTQYEADILSPEIQEEINNDLKGGLKAGINSTPTFYVNGKKIASPSSYEEFKTIIDEAAQTATADNS